MIPVNMTDRCDCQCRAECVVSAAARQVTRQHLCHITIHQSTGNFNI